MRHLLQSTVLASSVILSAAVANATPMLPGSINISSVHSTDVFVSATGATFENLTYPGTFVGLIAGTSGAFINLNDLQYVPFTSLTAAGGVVTSSTPLFSYTDSTTGTTLSFYGETYVFTAANVNEGNDALIGGYLLTSGGSIGSSDTPASINLQEVDGLKHPYDTFTSDLETSPIPEPNSLILLGTGLLGAAGMMTFRKRLA
jgi:hypothetical protein